MHQEHNTIRKPIFILGSARSGTSILYQLLSSHPDLCWFSNITNLNPEHSRLAALNRFTNIPIMKSFIYPSEGERIYTYCGFLDDRKTTFNTMATTTSDKFNEILRRHLEASGKPRFINKRTANTQRLDCLIHMFPDAYFIHIIRDGRAVVNSLLRVNWWENTPLWWRSNLTPSLWQQNGNAPEKLCALHWKRNIEEIRHFKSQLSRRYVEIRYENFVHDPRETIQNLMNFCQLYPSIKYISSLPESLPNMNNKWKEKLSSKQKKTISQTIDDYLHKLKY